MAPGASSSSSPLQPEDSAAPVVAVDCNGADLGPAEVAAGAAIAVARGARVILFGPADELGELPRGVEVVDAPLSIAKSADPAAFFDAVAIFSFLSNVSFPGFTVAPPAILELISSAPIWATR